VIRDGARILLIRRGHAIERAPGTWALVGGAVEPGESLEEALAREVREEVGVRIRPGEEFRRTIGPGGEFLIHWFEAAIDPAGQRPRPHPVEVAEVRWATPEEARALQPMLPSLREWLEEARGNAAG
jgi:8-oxo-dGTP pyrophosphatase MutT (NUDIX family)